MRAQILPTSSYLRALTLCRLKNFARHGGNTVGPTGEYLYDHNQASDIWSLGLVLYFLCFSALPYKNEDDVDALRAEIEQITRYVGDD